ncbi:MAG: acyl-CoA thioesterase [candidate division KSB1 bacterium]|nr:acyl-CoA thioesterase [candidate division KSB1 bacterium]
MAEQGRVQHAIEVRVRYVDTDQMGVAHHARYLEWFEMGRTELIRAMGLPYRDLEEAGYHLPVIEAYVQYRIPARYDDLLTIETAVDGKPGARLRLTYTVRRGQEVLATGYTVHAFVHQEGKPGKPPQIFLEALARRLSTSTQGPDRREALSGGPECDTHRIG